MERLELPESAKELVDDGMESFDKLLDEHRLQINKLQEEIRQKAKGVMAVVFRDFFEKWPEVEVLTWNQYTPYFNDGEECVFSVNDLYAVRSKEELDEVRHPEEVPDIFPRAPSDWEWANKDKYDDVAKNIEEWEALPLELQRESLTRGAELDKDVDKLSNFLQSLDEHLKVMFGDHVEILVTREGIEVRDHDHE